MTDNSSVHAAGDREQEWTAAPSHIVFLVPEGELLWAPVEHGDVLAGAVWIAVDPQQVPRAGIVVSAAVDELIQTDLGPLTLSVSRSTELDAGEFVAHLQDTRTGVYGQLSVGQVQRVGSLDELRVIVKQLYAERHQCQPVTPTTLA
jgi:hypothetical protein